MGLHDQPSPMTDDEMFAHCGSAIAKIDRGGLRGASMVTLEETTALALYVVATGGVPVCQHAFHARQGAGLEAARAAGGAL